VSPKHCLLHPRQPPPRLLVAEAQPAVNALAVGVDRRQVAKAGRGQADALVAKQLRPSRARRLLLVQRGAEFELALPAVAPGKELAVLYTATFLHSQHPVPASGRPGRGACGYVAGKKGADKDMQASGTRRSRKTFVSECGRAMGRHKKRLAALCVYVRTCWDQRLVLGLLPSLCTCARAGACMYPAIYETGRLSRQSRTKDDVFESSVPVNCTPRLGVSIRTTRDGR